MTLEAPLQALVDDGTLRHVSSESGVHEFAIDKLRHRAQTGFGPQTITYSLLVQDGVDEGRYEINDESDYQGGDNLLTTDSAEEVVRWIEGRLAGGAE